jgi:hypothetical protein
MSAEELRAKAAECYRFADLACPTVAAAVRALGEAFESAAAEVEMIEGQRRPPGPAN